jgi:hypothetical protein
MRELPEAPTCILEMELADFEPDLPGAIHQKRIEGLILKSAQEFGSA